jgi:hypothetical protein
MSETTGIFLLVRMPEPGSGPAQPFYSPCDADELQAEIEHRVNVLQATGILELQVLPTPEVQ